MKLPNIVPKLQSKCKCVLDSHASVSHFTHTDDSILTQIITCLHKIRNLALQQLLCLSICCDGLQAAEFAEQQLWDESTGRLRRSFCRNPSAVQGFADDYSYLISEHLSLQSMQSMYAYSPLPAAVLTAAG